MFSQIQLNNYSPQPNIVEFNMIMTMPTSHYQHLPTALVILDTWETILFHSK